MQSAGNGYYPYPRGQMHNVMGQYSSTSLAGEWHIESPVDSSPPVVEAAAKVAEATKEATEPASKKRKRMSRYKNASAAELSRRRAQNRASQRAYRERKDQRIKELEDLLKEAESKYETLSEQYVALQRLYSQLENECHKPSLSLSSGLNSRHTSYSTPSDADSFTGPNTFFDGLYYTLYSPELDGEFESNSIDYMAKRGCSVTVELKGTEQQ